MNRNKAGNWIETRKSHTGKSMGCGNGSIAILFGGITYGRLVIHVLSFAAAYSYASLGS